MIANQRTLFDAVATGDYAHSTEFFFVAQRPNPAGLAVASGAQGNVSTLFYLAVMGLAREFGADVARTVADEIVRGVTQALDDLPLNAR
ncbi:hypothetical protein TPY_2701 [Sulfobacillus acidophilus TPY]|uniref:Uncharacterized protein n=1 Tax=Sulfobacillus acidophilus (strain ATCC 700253 / DSM 10332 / NAL) TaxID=679936 RepID=G8TUN1_SULAD|nr:hypothetical protein TPY_2701 [Sulfobacillus acidophilus TPY]AEW04678.1 hypothetical protein Sulac_1178 [Sulfobacillus acidophilus DSM 10332]